MTYLQIYMNKVIENGIADLKHHHFKYRDHIMTLLRDGESTIKSIINVIDERVRRCNENIEPNLVHLRDEEREENECGDAHISPQDKTVSQSKV
jgi:hypothetical protein